MDTTIRRVSGFVKPRETESTDAKLDLSRGMPYEQRRRRYSAKSFSEDLFSEDSATVSTEALLAFLQNFLLTRFGPIEVETISEYEANEKINTTSKTSSIEALREKASLASRAYEHAADISRKSARRNNSHNTALQNAVHGDVQQVSLLIKDLRVLSGSGVTHVTIERGSSFLDSIIQAVKNTKKIK